MFAINQQSRSFDRPDMSDYKTPAKTHVGNLTTNASLFQSSIIGTNQLKTSQIYGNTQRKNDLFKQFHGNQTLSMREDIIQNNSSLTLHPVILHQDIAQLLQQTKIVAFLSKQQAEQKACIRGKQAILKRLNRDIQLLSDKINTLKAKCQQKKRNLADTQKKIKQVMKKIGIERDKQIAQMEMQIIKMKRTLSQKKTQNLNHQRQKHYPNRSQSSRSSRNNPVKKGQKNHKSNNPLIHDYNQQGQSQKYNQINYGNSPHNQNQRQRSSATINQFHKLPIQSQFNPQIFNNNIFEKPSKTISYTHDTGAKNSKFFYNNSDKNYPNIPMEIMAQKLRTQPRPPKKQKNIGLITEEDMDVVLKKQSEKSNNDRKSKNDIKKTKQKLQENYVQEDLHMQESQTIKININDPIKRSHQDDYDSNVHLDFLDEDISQKDEHSKIISSNNNKNGKVLQIHPDQDNKYLSEMVDMIDKSLRLSQQKRTIQAEQREKQVQRTKNKLQPNGPDIKLIQTNNGLFEYLLPEHSREVSNVSISYQSEQKKKSRSQDSVSLIKKQQIKKNQLRQSHVNILIQQSGYSPKNAQQDLFSPATKVLINQSISQKISRIQEVDQGFPSRQNTPIEQPDLDYDFDMISQSKLAMSQRTQKTKQNQNKIGNSVNLQQSNGFTQRSPPLSKPPSLQEVPQYVLPSQQNAQDDNDALSQIKLSSQSRIINNASSSLKVMSRYDKSEKLQEPDDDIFAINLVTESRISRQNKSKLKGMEQQLQQQKKQFQQRKKIISSDNGANNRTSLEQIEENNIFQYDQTLRKSTESSIIRKGSAIQKVKNRGNINTLKMSNYGNNSVQFGKSSQLLSRPIEEAQQEQQQAPVKSARHKKNSLSSYQ